jgi:hypothetical protein
VTRPKGGVIRLRQTLAGTVAVLLSLFGLSESAAAATARQTFLLTQLPGEQGITVTAIGPIRAVGTDVVLSEEEDEETGVIVARDRFDFAEGSLFVTTYVTPEFEFDPRSCVGRGGGGLTYEITGGTGAYEGATGSGTGTFRVVSVGGRNPDGSCSPDQEDEVVHLFIVTLTGTATVPD